MDMQITINKDAFRGSVESTAEKYDAAFKVAANMIASMMQVAVSEDIRSSGNFGDKYLQSLRVTAEDNVITTTIDAPGADLFETGGTISGHPLLWLPISGTDAEGIQASNYGDQLFSVNRKTGGVPLLFSIRDRAPKYFGVPSVEVPKKFHIAETEIKVMQDFPQIFQDALKEA